MAEGRQGGQGWARTLKQHAEKHSATNAEQGPAGEALPRPPEATHQPQNPSKTFRFTPKTLHLSPPRSTDHNGTDSESSGLGDWEFTAGLINKMVYHKITFLYMFCVLD